MWLNQKVVNGIWELSIDGEVDASSSIQVDNAIKETLKNGHYRILINCQKLKYISSAGLGVFISYLDEIRNNNGAIVFCNMSESVLSVFTILGLNELVPIVPTYEDALKIVNEG